MRCFLGCDLTPKGKIDLDQWRDKALRYQGQIQPVKPANFHITTWFLGQVSESQIDGLVGAIERELPRHPIPPFSVCLDDIVVWSKPKILAAIPRTVPNELSDLHAFSKRCADLAKITTRGNHDEFRPHVTLNRKVKPEQVAPPLFLPKVDTQVTKLHLFESISGEKGVRYASRFAFPLSDSLSVRDRLKAGI